MSALIQVAAHLEGEVLLGEVTKGNHNDSCEHFRDGWIDLEMLHKKLDEDVIQVHTNQYQQEIPEQLDGSAQDGAGKNDVFI